MFTYQITLSAMPMTEIRIRMICSFKTSVMPFLLKKPAMVNNPKSMVN